MSTSDFILHFNFIQSIGEIIKKNTLLLNEYWAYACPFKSHS